MARRMHPMEPGERDRQVVIEQAGEATGSGGFPTETWTTLCTMFASRQDLSARERLQGGVEAEFTTRWEVNYRTDLDPELVDVPKLRRLTYQGRVHDVIEASVIGRREGVELLTRASSSTT